MSSQSVFMVHTSFPCLGWIGSYRWKGLYSIRRQRPSIKEVDASVEVHSRTEYKHECIVDVTAACGKRLVHSVVEFLK
jgi:hypothetical protein